MKKRIFRRIVFLLFAVLMSNVAFGQTTATGTSPGSEAEGMVFTSNDNKFAFVVTKVATSATSNDGEVTIRRTNIVDPEGAMVIPSTVTCTWNVGTVYETSRTYSVTEIGVDAFRECTGLTSVTIPGSVRKISNYAFYYCYNLTSVTIQNGVDSIGYRAFSYCSSLTSVVIPNSVTYLNSYVFDNCRLLERVTISNRLVELRSRTFAACYALNNVTIPNSVKIIGEYAFESCTSLTGITIPASVTKIDAGAFRYNSSLASVTFAQGTDSLTIGTYAFAHDTSLTSIDIPCRAYVWDPSAFTGCSNLTAINVCPTDPNYKSDGGVIYSGDWKKVILCPGGKKGSYTIKNTAVEIGESAFNGCRKLTSVTIPNSVKTIGVDAFRDCTGLTSVTIPGSVRKISNYAFYYCTGLTSVTIQNGVDSIGYRAFSYCSSLTSVVIPNSVTYLGSYVFDHCHLLERVTISNRLVELPSHTFAACYTLNNVTIPNSVKIIGEYAFESCTSLTGITIPASVTKIDAGAFRYNSSLASVTFAQGTDSLTIGTYAFAHDTSLTSIYNKNLIIPELSSTQAFGTTNTGGITLYVPCQVVTKYRGEDGNLWQLFIGEGQIVSSGSNTVISAVRGHMVIPKDESNCKTTVADVVMIYPNSSIVFTDNTEGTQVYQKLAGKKFILQQELQFGKWNLVPNPYDADAGKLTYKVFNDNMGDKSGLTHEMTGLPYDYQNNSWLNKYPKVKDNLPTEKMTSIFMWPYKDWVVKGIGTDSTYNEKNTNINDNHTVFEIHKGIAEVESSQDGEVTDTQENNGISNNGIWFAKHNICIGRLDIAKFIATNSSNIQGQLVYLYDANKKEWVDTTAGTIDPGQGFMIASALDASSNTVTFVRKDVYHPSGGAKSDIVRKEIVFTTRANNTHKVARAVVDANAQDGFDIKDAYILISENNEEVVEPYFLVDNRHIMHNVFQSLPYEAPINFHASKQSQVEFTMNNSYDNIEVSIVDVNTNEETILENGEVFNFVAEAGENEGRYKIRFNKKSVGIEEVENTVDVRFEQNAGAIEIFGNDLQNVEVINTLGQTIYNQKVGGNQTKVENLNTGAYIIKVKTSNGTATEKIIVK